MSLDIYLYQTEPCPHCGGEIIGDAIEYGGEFNITHNLTKMADEAGIYYAIWRPEELFKVPKCKDVLDIIKEGYKKMLDDPERYKKFNPSNGWGNYSGFCEWIEKLISAYEENPEAVIRCSR